MKRETKDNLQVKQPFIQQEKPNDGWPEPLADTSNPVKYSYVNGKSGSVESRPVTSVKRGE